MLEVTCLEDDDNPVVTESDTAIIFMQEQLRHGLVEYSSLNLQAGKKGNRVDQALENRKREESNQKMQRQIADFKKPKSRKHAHKIIREQAPNYISYDLVPGLVDIEARTLHPRLPPSKGDTILRPTPMHLRAHRVKNGGLQALAELHRAGAAIVDTSEEDERIDQEARIRKLRVKELERRRLEAEFDEDAVDIIPWVPKTYAEKRRIDCESHFDEFEKDHIAEKALSMAQTWEQNLEQRNKKASYWRRARRSFSLCMNLCSLDVTDGVGLFTTDPARPLRWLYFGSSDLAKDDKRLDGMGVTHIINATHGIPLFFPEKYIYFRVRISDSEDETEDKMMQVLMSVSNILANIKKRGGVVYVHCNQGTSRAPSLVIAYLIIHEKCKLHDALNLCRATKIATYPNGRFLYYLAMLEVRQLGVTSVARSNIFRKVGEYESWKKSHRTTKRSGGRGIWGTYGRLWRQ